MLLALPAAIMIGLVGCSGTTKSGATAQSAMVINKDSPELAKVGYSLGYSIGKGNRDMIDDLDVEAFVTGFREAYANKDSQLTEEQMQKILMAYQKKKEAEVMQKIQSEAAENKKAGDAYLVDNAKKDGVKVLESGLQYKVLKEGTGASPKADSTVKVHYEGRLLDGTVFDSSKERGEPIEFPVNRVIPGWTEGLQLMKTGGEYQLYIPADLAYGETGTDGIPPNSTLIFDVELLEIK